MIIIGTRYRSSPRKDSGDEKILDRLLVRVESNVRNSNRRSLRPHFGTLSPTRNQRRKSAGSGLRYSFDIKDGKTTYEVGVDAQTGKVLENAAEGAHPD